MFIYTYIYVYLYIYIYSYIRFLAKGVVDCVNGSMSSPGIVGATSTAFSKE